MTKAPLWSAAEAAKATNGSLLGSSSWIAQGVSIDSRTVQKDDLFIALTGPNQNGHAYVAKALEAGAAACLVSEDVEGLPSDAPLIRVGDTLEGLNALGIAARERCMAKRI